MVSNPGMSNYNLYRAIMNGNPDVSDMSTSEFVALAIFEYTRKARGTRAKGIPLSYPYFGDRKSEERVMISYDNVECIHDVHHFPFSDDVEYELGGIFPEPSASRYRWLTAVIEKDRHQMESRSFYLGEKKIRHDELGKYLELLPMPVIKSMLAYVAPPPKPVVECVRFHTRTGADPAIIIPVNHLHRHGHAYDTVDNNNSWTLDVDDPISELVSAMVRLSFDRTPGHKHDRKFMAALSQASCKDIEEYGQIVNQIKNGLARRRIWS